LQQFKKRHPLNAQHILVHLKPSDFIKSFCFLFLTLLVPASTDETIRDCSGNTAAVCTATQLSTGSLGTTPLPGCKSKWLY
jgi:hypothetical protein